MNNLIWLSIIFILKMIIAQQSQALDESQRKHESEVYDDLSLFMQIFKQILIAIEEIGFNHQRQLNCQMPQEKLSMLSKKLQVLQQKYSQISGLLRIQIRTFQRFINRLIETIALYQLKYHNNSSLQARFVVNTLAEIQSVVKENQSIYHFLKFIKATKGVADRLSRIKNQDLTQMIKKDTSPKNMLGKRVKVLDKIDPKMSRSRQFERNADVCQSQQEDAEQQTAKLSVISQNKAHSLPFSHSISTDLQKNFDLYRGLELDYSSFKSSYFSAKSNTQQFYRQYLERNYLISKLMKTYHDDFCLYQKKKLFRNNKRVLNKKPVNRSYQKQVHKINYSQIIQTERAAQNDLFSKKAVIHREQQKFQREQLKNSYKMNNVYLTFGKKPIINVKDTRHCPNITPNINKNKQQKSNFYFNHSFCPKKDLTITQSIDFGKIIFDMNESHRIKTSPNKYLVSQANRFAKKQILKSLKQQNQAFLGNKRKYLQIDCLQKKEISLNKIILTGNVNVRNLRMNKHQ